MQVKYTVFPLYNCISVKGQIMGISSQLSRLGSFLIAENFSGASGRTCAALCTAAFSWHYAVRTCRDIHPTYYIYYLFYAAAFKQQLATTITLPTLPTPTTRNTAALLRWKFQTSFSHAMYFYMPAY